MTPTPHIPGADLADARLREIIDHRRIGGALGFKYRRSGEAITPEFFEERSIPEPNTGCWLWLGHVDEDGYGTFLDDDGKTVRANRQSAIVSGLTLAAGEVVRHRCDQPGCVNPEHLLPGTVTDNNRDTVRRGRHVTMSGAMSHFAVLSDEDVLAIRRDPRSQREIGTVFGISQQHVSKIKRGLAWKK